MWRSADAVCFDVDSTVITMEPLDQLAAFCGAGDEVAQLCVVAVLSAARANHPALLCPYV